MSGAQRIDEIVELLEAFALGEIDLPRDAAIRCLRPGDQLVVTKLDRFARSLEHAIKLERCIAAKGASLVILDPAVDTSTSMGRLMFNMIGAIAQFEREIMLDRQRDGVAAAQAAGKYVGPADSASQGGRGHDAKGRRGCQYRNRTAARYWHCQRVSHLKGR
jgi:DNA invertase Pin-like site-specific DNA recombinase